MINFSNQKILKQIKNKINSGIKPQYIYKNGWTISLDDMVLSHNGTKEEAIIWWEDFQENIEKLDLKNFMGVIPLTDIPKGLSKVNYRKENNSYILFYKTKDIARFECKEVAFNWWAKYCHFRGVKAREPRSREQPSASQLSSNKLKSKIPLEIIEPLHINSASPSKLSHFEGVKIPNSFNQNSRRIWLYNSSDMWKLSTRNEVLTELFTKEAAIDWWFGFCKARKVEAKEPIESNPTKFKPKSKKKKTLTRMTDKPKAKGRCSCLGTNENCFKCGGTGRL